MGILRDKSLKSNSDQKDEKEGVLERQGNIESIKRKVNNEKREIKSKMAKLRTRQTELTKFSKEMVDRYGGYDNIPKKIKTGIEEKRKKLSVRMSELKERLKNIEKQETVESFVKELKGI